MASLHKIRDTDKRDIQSEEPDGSFSRVGLPQCASSLEKLETHTNALKFHDISDLELIFSMPEKIEYFLGPKNVVF